MSNILLDLYHGELAPAAVHNDKLPEHQKKRQACRQRYDALFARLDSLNPELRQAFDQFLDDQLFSDMLELPEAFIEGFRMGAKMMLAVMEE